MTVKYPVKRFKRPTALAKIPNGRLPAAVLKKIPDTQIRNGQLYIEAADAYIKLKRGARQAGHSIELLGRGYRTYDETYTLFIDRYSNKKTARKPAVTRLWNGQRWWLKKGKSPAATPGNSVHNIGCAVDIKTTPAGWSWLIKNAPTYGWYWQTQPVKPNGQKNPEFERWHLDWCDAK